MAVNRKNSRVNGVQPEKTALTAFIRKNSGVNDVQQEKKRRQRRLSGKTAVAVAFNRKIAALTAFNRKNSGVNDVSPEKNWH